MQSEEAGPEQVAHSEAHGTQTSLVVADPPAHVKPSSMARQSLLHPSVLNELLSSQISTPIRLPSPQMGEQIDFVLIEPPVHSKPTSNVHVALQPSPPIVLSA